MKRHELLLLIESEFGPGCAAICKERARQIEIKGYDVKRDRELYREEELADAAVTYALHPKDEPSGVDRKLYKWPWSYQYWNPTPDNRVREFEKAGALMAAQIDFSISER